MVPGMNRHHPHPRDDQQLRYAANTPPQGFVSAAVVARLACRDLSTIHRWCRIGYLAGAIRGTGPGRQPWLIPSAECHRVAVTTVPMDDGLETWP